MNAGKMPCRSYSFPYLLEMMQTQRKSCNNTNMDKNAVDCMELLSDLAMNHYLVQQYDVRMCPNTSCKNAGFVEINDATGRILCQSKFKCDQCNTSWQDPLQWKSTGNVFKDACYGIQGGVTKLRHNFTLLTTAEPCPNCQIWIQKVHGCEHMQCQKCKYEFCWFCLGSYKGYQHSDGFNCTQSSASRWSINVLCILAVLLKSKLLNFILLAIYWVPCFVVTNIVIYYCVCSFFWVFD